MEKEIRSISGNTKTYKIQKIVMIQNCLKWWILNNNNKKHCYFVLFFINGWAEEKARKILRGRKQQSFSEHWGLPWEHPPIFSGLQIGSKGVAWGKRIKSLGPKQGGNLNSNILSVGEWGDMLSIEHSVHICLSQPGQKRKKEVYLLSSTWGQNSYQVSGLTKLKLKIQLWGILS